MKRILILHLIISLFVGACTSSEPSQDTVPAYEFEYNIDDPQESFKLSKRLKEISGITLSQDEHQILAIQDEDGILFFINAETGNIEHEVLFGQNADYEDLTRVDNHVYILNAKGQLTKLSLDSKQATPLATTLNEDYDTEGLCYDAIRGELWIACKDNEQFAKKVERSRPIFAYNLKKEKLEQKPAYQIIWADVLIFLQAASDDKNYNKLRDKFLDEKKNQIEPSAIAIHPLTDEIYILTAKGETLLVMNRQGRILAMQHLSDDLFEQPEGLAFYKNGDLLIASEGKKHKARIHRFEWLKQ